MADSFNPYREWLGVQSPERPPNHYALLGLEPFEDRPRAITAAADAALARVRAVRPGSHAVDWQRMLDELTMAKLCLADPMRRLQYDNQLRDRAAPYQAQPNYLSSQLDVPAGQPDSGSAASDFFPPGPAATAWGNQTAWAAPAPAQPSAPSHVESTYAAQASNAYALPPGHPAGGATYPAAPAPAVTPSTVIGHEYAAPAPAAPAVAYAAPLAYAATAAPALVQPSYVAPAPLAVPLAQPVAQSMAAPAQAKPFSAPLATPLARPAPQNLDAPRAMPIAGVASAPVQSAAVEQLETGDRGVVLPSPDMWDATGSSQPRSIVSAPRALYDDSAAAESAHPGFSFKPIPLKPMPAAASASGALLNAMGGPMGELNSPSLPRTAAKPQFSPVLWMGVTAGIVLFSLAVAIILMGKRGGEKPDAGRQVAASGSNAATLPEDLAPEKSKTVKPHVPETPVKAAEKPKPAHHEPVIGPIVQNDPEPPKVAELPKVTGPPVKEPKPVASNPDPAPVNPPKPAADRARTAAWSKAVNNARAALGGRDIERAKTELKAAAAAADSDEQHAQVGRLEMLVGYVDGFWNAVRQSMQGLQAADELKYGDNVFSVVEAGAQDVTLHAAGRNFRYTISDMPADFAMFLAERWFDQKAANKLFLGAFMAVDPKGSLQQARRYWEEATRGGASAEALMPLLDQKGVAGGGPIGTDQQSAVPEGKALVQAQRVFNETFAADLRDSKPLPRKVELAHKLIDTAAASTDPPQRYVLLREAAELASAGGDPGTMSEAVDALARGFKIDPLEMKASALVKANAAASNQIVSRAVAQAALELVDQALAAKRLKEAALLTRTALAAARKCRDQDLLKQAAQRNKQVQGLTKTTD